MLSFRPWFVGVEGLAQDAIARLITDAKRKALKELREMYGTDCKYEFVDLPDLGSGPRGFVCVVPRGTARHNRPVLWRGSRRVE